MATNDSQLNEEIEPLTNEAKEMEKELADQENTTSLSFAQTPRWLSLSPYKSVLEHWEWDNEVADSLILPSPLASSFHSPGCHCQICHLQSSQLADSLHSSGCRCQICHIKQDDGYSSWSSESNGQLDLVEKANCRILGVLRCYLYNLEQGTLITGSKVDERVEAALKRWVGRGKDVQNCREEAEGALNGMKESWEISDEERVVVEIDAYGRDLMKIECEIPDDIVEAAHKILEWARMKGTEDGREMNMTSLEASFEMVRC